MLCARLQADQYAQTTPQPAAISCVHLRTEDKKRLTACGPACRRLVLGSLHGQDSPPSLHRAGLASRTHPAGLGHNRLRCLSLHQFRFHPRSLLQPRLQLQSQSQHLLLLLLPVSSVYWAGLRTLAGITRDSQDGLDRIHLSRLYTGFHPHLDLYVPYNLNLTRGVYDKMMMTILGNVKPNAKMFTVNFLRGYDIAFHINPRFSEGGKQVLVRNHKLGERWGQEERDLKVPFPFALGSPFEMKILCTPEAFRVAVNNIPLFEFRHRVREINQIDRINILHDVVLTYINVETLP
ncbi:putative galectin-3-like [Scophthalmus maximus]|uniref:Galectin n=1 Tax=Scophthalmus maximus TaxID=52904 RepID=A0A2U9CSX3_SCOMX|nr:putative galectin-3-like [Scophthalmus maximus]